jgi:predicted nuclease of predicted toxin-antitoxin system
LKLLVDENLSARHARTVRDLGHDAVSVVELGLSGAEDSAVRNAAIEHGRVLLTLDADFANILRFPPGETPGVVRLRVHPAIEESIDAAIRFAIPRLDSMDLQGKLAVVHERNIRIRG